MEIQTETKTETEIGHRNRNRGRYTNSYMEHEQKRRLPYTFASVFAQVFA